MSKDGVFNINFPSNTVNICSCENYVKYHSIKISEERKFTTEKEREEVWQ